MSVSLISLRLEIAEDYSLLPHLHFTASRQTRSMAMTDASKRKGMGSKDDNNMPLNDSSGTISIEKCHGSRKLQEMTVESFSNDGKPEVKQNIQEDDSLNSEVASGTQTHDKQQALPVKETKVPAEKNQIVERQEKKSSDKKGKKCKNKTEVSQRISLVEEPEVIKTEDNVVKENKMPEDSLNVIASKTMNVNCIAPKENIVDINIERRNRLLHPSPISFSSGNHFVEVTKGLLHLYKENQRTPLAEEAERSEMLCILAVPATMTTHDLLQFVAPVSTDIENMRIIRENKPNQYMVLIKFRNQLSADIFYNNFNGEKFNSIEPEVCHLAYVNKVETMKESQESCLPLQGHTELPTCPVCLERMDESVEGILTILCNHAFHGSCLAQWGDTSCPVCRYSQTPELMPDNRCVECGSQDSLWICLICGHIGCGRYVDGHAYKHYLDTQHTYAMQLGNNRVWDYAGDNYVHRLVQNKADGKPVELEPRWLENEEKMDSMQLEYTYLLTSQLEAQRHYFENRLTRFEAEASQQLEEMKEKTKHAIDERKQLEEKLNRVTREKFVQDKKLTQISTKLNKISTELREEKEFNKCLRLNQALWQNKISVTESALKEIKASKEKEITNLQEQVRDLMFYFEAKDKLQDVPDVSSKEIEEGHIVIGEASGSSSGSTRSRKKKNR